MPSRLASYLAVTVTVALLVTGCAGGDDGDPEGAPSDGTSESASPEPTPTPTPSTSPTTEPGTYPCSAVSDERASSLYGRPVVVDEGGGNGCMFEEEDFLEQDLTVLWQVDPAPRATLETVRRGLGVRSDDATRTTLAGGVPGWEVRMVPESAVMVAALVDGEQVFVNVMCKNPMEPSRTVAELAVIARAIAETYTV